MKKWILAVFSLLMVVIVSSCKKDDLDPISGFNSKLDINVIAMEGLSGLAEVRGVLSREYILTTDTSTDPVTDFYVDTFAINGNGHSQNFHFNTPSNATKCNVQVKILISDEIKATSAKIGAIIYSRDKSALLSDENVTLSGTNTSTFNSKIYAVDLK